ncbi:MAG: ATP synthase subunit I [Fibrobacteria bacterium]
MNEFLQLMPAWGAGLGIGAVFFGGLWWTVRQGVASKLPAVWFLGSLIIRMGIAVAGFYLVSGHHFGRLLACLLGFIMARMAVNRFIRPPLEIRARAEPSEERSGHAA